MIGLERVDGGSITVEGEPFVKNGVYASPAEAKRTTAKMGMVFQSFNLFPHLSVRRNLTMPLMSVKGATRDEADERAALLLGKVGPVSYTHLDVYKRQAPPRLHLTT